ncbi:MAG: hypothetical protein SPL99_05370 [Catonella sp.]|nr:hypothetical protein [Catonella sp.]
MAKERKCSYCGGYGHDARNCPARKADEPKDKAVWYKIEDLSDSQADQMTSGVMKLKRKIAPESQASYVKADKKSLPERIRKAIGTKDDD